MYGLYSRVASNQERPMMARVRYMDPPQGVPGESKDAQIYTPFEVWCAKIASKLKNIQPTLRKEVFLSLIFNFDNFSKFVLLGSNSFICKKNLLV